MATMMESISHIYIQVRIAFRERGRCDMMMPTVKTAVATLNERTFIE